MATACVERAPTPRTCPGPASASEQLNPEDWLMRFCKRLKTLSFTVNRELVINSLPTAYFVFIVSKLR
jgi:hypothetical protein